MRTILVIEDNEALRENTAELLELNAYQVLTAENGRSGYAMAKAHPPDVVLCDMVMPQSDGMAFLRLLRDDKELQHTPVVFFSAGTLSLSEQRQLARLGDDFLQKPFSETALLQKIQAFSPHKE